VADRACGGDDAEGEEPWRRVRGHARGAVEVSRSDSSDALPNEDFAKALPGLADNFEIDRPFTQDRQRASQLDLSLVTIAGEFLDLAEGVVRSEDPDEREEQLLSLIDRFLNGIKATPTEPADLPLPDLSALASGSSPDVGGPAPTRVAPEVLAAMEAVLTGGDFDGETLFVHGGKHLQQALTTYRDELMALSKREDSDDIAAWTRTCCPARTRSKSFRNPKQSRRPSERSAG
jgi:hypothetical protein